MTIMIRLLFGGWREVSEDQARNWVRNRWSGFTARGWTFETKREYLGERVRGIGIDELLEGLR